MGHVPGRTSPRTGSARLGLSDHELERKPADSKRRVYRRAGRLGLFSQSLATREARIRRTCAGERRYQEGVSAGAYVPDIGSLGRAPRLADVLRWPSPELFPRAQRLISLS